LVGWRRSLIVGDLSEWDRQCRELFEEIVNEPVALQPEFGDEVGRALQQFLMKNLSNMGVGADYDGNEGLDPDGIDAVAKRRLVARPAVLAALEQLQDDKGLLLTDVLSMSEGEVRQNAAYLINVVTGLSAGIVRNMMRHESALDHRAAGPMALFPLSFAMSVHQGLPDLSENHFGRSGPKPEAK
jgi:hypothetical protein